MLTPRDLHHAHREAARRTGANSTPWSEISEAEAGMWREMAAELESIESHRNAPGTVELIVSGTGEGETIDWIDDEVSESNAAAARRFETVRGTIQPFEPNPKRRYRVVTLRRNRWDTSADNAS